MRMRASMTWRAKLEMKMVRSALAMLVSIRRSSIQLRSRCKPNGIARRARWSKGIMFRNIVTVRQPAGVRVEISPPGQNSMSARSRVRMPGSTSISQALRSSGFSVGQAVRPRPDAPILWQLQGERGVRRVDPAPDDRAGVQADSSGMSRPPPMRADSALITILILTSAPGEAAANPTRPHRSARSERRSLQILLLRTIASQLPVIADGHARASTCRTCRGSPTAR